MFKFINGVILFLYLLSHHCVATPINTTQGFTPYADNLCTSALDVASNSRNVLYNTLLADIDIMDYEYGNGHKYENVRFSQAKNSSNHSATFYTPHVYWKVPDPGAGCKLILLQGGEGDLVGPSQLNDLPGRIMLRASRAGCFYSPIRPAETLFASFCCGREDCRRVEIESTEARDRRKVPFEDPPLEEGEDPHGPWEPTHRDKWNPTKGRYEPLPHCTVRPTTVTKYEVYAAGVQQALSEGQRCSTRKRDAPGDWPDPCSPDFTVGTWVTTAMNITETHTWPIQNAFRIRIHRGFTYVKTRPSIEWEFAKGFADYTHGNVTMNQQVFSFHSPNRGMGTAGFLSFTPHYLHVRADIGCGRDDSGRDIHVAQIDYYEPILSNEGMPVGRMNMVFVSDVAY
ncbi:hypothetical protein E8E14_013174 [Neopestalotiopsis sp. 37M]|nr:hypothetical protein E8E14_013174 [Neopestalotiopsis sp. 37M]